MKHFNFKTLAMGAALAGSLFTTNAAQAQDVTGLSDVNIVTLQWNKTGRYAGFNGATSWANNNTSFGTPGGAMEGLL